MSDGNQNGTQQRAMRAPQAQQAQITPLGESGYGIAACGMGAHVDAEKGIVTFGLFALGGKITTLVPMQPVSVLVHKIHTMALADVVEAFKEVQP